MSWFQKLMPSRIRTEGGSKRNVPEGLWTKCKSCSAVLYRPELERNLQVCLLETAVIEIMETTLHFLDLKEVAA